MAIIAKPRNLREAAAVEAALREKYPQMYREGWNKKGKKTRNKAPVANIKQAKKEQAKSLKGALTGDEIKRLIGR